MNDFEIHEHFTLTFHLPPATRYAHFKRVKVLLLTGREILSHYDFPEKKFRYWGRTYNILQPVRVNKDKSYLVSFREPASEDFAPYVLIHRSAYHPINKDRVNEHSNATACKE